MRRAPCSAGARRVEVAHDGRVQRVGPRAARRPARSAPCSTNRPYSASDVSGKSARVCAPRDSSRAVAAATIAARHAHAGCGPRTSARHASRQLVGERRRDRASVTARALQARGIAHDAAVGRHRVLDRAAHLVGVARRRRCAAHDGVEIGRRRLPRSSTPVIAPVGSARRSCRRRSPRRHASRTRARRAASSTRAGWRRARRCTRLRRTTRGAAASSRRRGR